MTKSKSSGDQTTALEGSSPEAPDPRAAWFSIAAVERDTGLSKDTLRMWERRYGFPRPARDDLGERAYAWDELNKLRVIKRLLDMGHRPGKIIELPLEDLQKLASPEGSDPRAPEATRAARSRGHPGSPTPPGEDLRPFLDLVKAHRSEELRGLLSQAALRLGVARFVGTLVAALNEAVGDAWTRGELEIFEEHLYTEAVQGVLRNAIGAIAPARRPPAVVLTTFPQEPHGLGILMAEAIFALEECRCVSLGVQTPIWDIALAASGREIDVVALSFTGTLPVNAVVDGLAQLRARLPAGIEIWAGGHCPTLHRRRPPQVRVFTTLDEIPAAVAEWRAARAAAV